MHMRASLLVGSITGLDVLWPARTPEAAAFSTVRAVRGWIGRAVRGWGAIAQAERDRATLLALSDHMLRDIGISRHEILDSIAQGASSRTVRP